MLWVVVTWPLSNTPSLSPQHLTLESAIEETEWVVIKLPLSKPSSVTCSHSIPSPKTLGQMSWLELAAGMGQLLSNAPSSMHSHWLWVVMKGPGCLFLHTWEWGGDVGCGPKLISPRKAGSTGLFALCLGGRKSHCTFHNGGKKMYLPFSHSNFHYSSLGE